MRILIIRLSSFGDIVQALAAVDSVKAMHPNAHITWVTKAEFASLVALHPGINDVVAFSKKDGILGWIKLAKSLANRNFDLLYDAHLNVRTLFLRGIFKLYSKKTKIIIRSKERWKRFLLFRYHINKFEWPYRGMLSFLKPLEEAGFSKNVTVRKEWDFKTPFVDLPEDFDPRFSSEVITISPSAAWEMKRWPLPYWKNLISIMPEYKFLILAGPQDKFCNELVKIDSDRVISLHGRVSLIQTFQIIAASKLLISADTGSLHVADITGVPAIALLGPTAFGFTTNPQVVTLQVDMPCRPCSKDGRGGCHQPIYQQCMIDISPIDVMQAAKVILGA